MYFDYYTYFQLHYTIWKNVKFEFLVYWSKNAKFAKLILKCKPICPPELLNATPIPVCLSDQSGKQRLLDLFQLSEIYLEFQCKY